MGNVQKTYERSGPDQCIENVSDAVVTKAQSKRVDKLRWALKVS